MTVLLCNNDCEFTVCVKCVKKDCEAVCDNKGMEDPVCKSCVDTESPEGESRCAPDCKDKWTTADCASCMESMKPPEKDDHDLLEKAAKMACDEECSLKSCTECENACDKPPCGCELVCEQDMDSCDNCIDTVHVCNDACEFVRCVKCVKKDCEMVCDKKGM